MLQRRSLFYAVIVTALLISAVFGAYAVSAQTGTTPTTAATTAEDQSTQPFTPTQMTGAMTGLMDQMEAMLAAAPDDAARQRMAPAMMNALNGMMGLNQAMMEQMGQMPATDRQAMTGPMMESMTRMTGMMGRMQPMMSSGSSMTGTQTMGPMGGGMQMGQMMGMMGQMMQMMGTGMMGGGMTGDANPMTGAMPMTDTQAMGPMSGGMPMGGDTQMGQMMQMMGMMMQMMGRMHAMHGMMGEGMMGGAGMGPMGATSVMTGTAPAAPTTPATHAATGEAAPQSIEGGGVTVKVTPLNLGDATADTLDFEVVLDTHSVELNYDIAQLATLTDNLGNEYTPAAWTPEQSSGHHVSGKLRFADRAALLQSGVTELTLDVTNIAGVDSRPFTWTVGE